MSRDRTVGPVDVGRIEPFPRPMTAFVGRHRDLASVNAVLRYAQVVCLTGPAGCGKTRLAIEVARAEDEQFPGSVCWVDLAPLRTADAVPRALANALGVREAAGRELLDSIVAHLADTPYLLMLDSCEHLLPDCSAVVRRLLTECPTLRVLATSRELLGLVGERVWQVAPLTFPESDAVRSPDELLEYESVQLFCERAEIALPGFRLDDGRSGSCPG